MNDPVRILDNPQYLTITDPARIKGLSATLGVKQRRAQHHCKFVLVGRAIQDLHIGLELITMEKEAKRHIPCSY
ncbi:hypothetical protein D3C78_1603580 [compost metagenome]